MHRTRHRVKRAVGRPPRQQDLVSKHPTSLFGRAVAKLRINDRTAPRDLAAAKAIRPGIEAEFLGYGIKLRANGPPGT